MPKENLNYAAIFIALLSYGALLIYLFPNQRNKDNWKKETQYDKSKWK